MSLAWHQTASCSFYFNLIFFSHLYIYFLQSLATIGHAVQELLRAIITNHNLSVSFLKIPQIPMRAALRKSFCFAARSWITSSQHPSQPPHQKLEAHRSAHITFPFTSCWILQFYLYFARAASTLRTVTEEREMAVWWERRQIHTGTPLYLLPYGKEEEVLQESKGRVLCTSVYFLMAAQTAASTGPDCHRIRQNSRELITAWSGLNTDYSPGSLLMSLDRTSSWRNENRTQGRH